MELMKVSAKRFKKKITRKNIFSLLGKICIYALLIDLVFVFLYPFLYMIITSLKSPLDLNDISVNWLINEFHVKNYKLAFQVLDYPRRFLNTAGVSVLSVVGHVISCSFVGYGFARFKFKGKVFFFTSLVFSIIVPIQTIIIPIYFIFTRLGWVGTYLPIIIPSYLGFGLKGGLFVFIFRQFYLTLPKSLEEAASIDGCGAIKTFFKIALPSSGSSMLICIVLGMVWHWNDIFEPAIYLTKQSQYFLPQVLPGLYDIIKAMSSASMLETDVQNLFNDGVVMATTALTILPLIIIYAVLQRKFMQSVERSGLTGE